MELLVTFGTSKYDVDPNAHCFRTWRHQVVSSFARFDTKSQFRIWRTHRLQMVNINLFNRLFKVKISTKY